MQLEHIDQAVRHLHVQHCLIKKTQTQKKSKVMKTEKTSARTAKKSAKRALIVSMAAIAGTSVSQMEAAARAAMHDMRLDMGLDATVLTYTYNPFDGLYA